MNDKARDKDRMNFLKETGCPQMHNEIFPRRKHSILCQFLVSAAYYKSNLIAVINTE